MPTISCICPLHSPSRITITEDGPDAILTLGCKSTRRNKADLLAILKAPKTYLNYTHLTSTDRSTTYILMIDNEKTCRIVNPANRSEYTDFLTSDLITALETKPQTCGLTINYDEYCSPIDWSSEPFVLFGIGDLSKATPADLQELKERHSRHPNAKFIHSVNFGEYFSEPSLTLTVDR